MAERSTEVIGKTAGKLKAAREVATGNVGLFKKLGEEHTVVTVMAARIAAARHASVRAELFPRFREELLAHARAEEVVFYPVLEHHGLRFLAEKARNHHIAVEMMLEDLTSMSYDDEDWRPLFLWMVENVRLHVRLEEDEIFPKARTFIDAARARELESRYAREKASLRR